MAVIDGIFCLDARVLYKRDMLSVFTLEWSEIMGTYCWCAVNLGLLKRYYHKDKASAHGVRVLYHANITLIGLS